MYNALFAGLELGLPLGGEGGPRATAPCHRSGTARNRRPPARGPAPRLTERGPGLGVPPAGIFMHRTN